MTERAEHSWAVDSIAEDVVHVEEDGERMLTIPRHLLPAEVKEGQLLRVTREPASVKGAIVLTIAIDEAETAKTLARSKRKTDEILASSLKNDQGGDVVL